MEEEDKNKMETMTTNNNSNVSRLRNYSKTAYNVMKSRDWKGTLRGPQVFFGITETSSSDQVSSEAKHWNVPKGSEIGPRLTKNCGFFATNYALFSSALMVYEILSDWTIMLWIFGVFGIWTFVLRAAAAGSLFPLEVAGFMIEKRVLYLTMSLCTAIILAVYVGSTFLFVTGCTCVVSGIHSTFRNPLAYKSHDSLETESFTGSIETGGVEMSSAGDNI
jgi:hypothetical protein